MDVKMDDLKISSNWITENENTFKKLVTCVQGDNEMCDIEHITPETCICLIKGENQNADSKPEVDIELKSLIQEISIFSEGSLIEVFGVHNEYLFTCAPQFVDDWEGMAVYHAKIVLPCIHSCKLKFSRIKESGRLWIYSVQLSVIKPEGLSNSLLFNFEKVNKLINNSSQQISEKAEKFKKFFELYAKNSSKSQSLNIQTLLNVISREYNPQFSDCGMLLNFLNLSDSTNGKKEWDKNNMSLECQYIKSYIDRKFIEMKTDLMKCIENKLDELKNEHNAKLDQIIKSLESSKV